jgi:hypothetical protein
MAHFSFTIAINLVFFSILGAFCPLISSDYLLPSNHPIKPMLDAIFSVSRVTSSKETLQQAGFKIATKEHYSHTVIARHPKVPGYIFKLYTDDQTWIDDEEKLMQRIQGALLAQEIIGKHGWEAYFKVPQKLLYRLPKSLNPEGKRFILIAEDLHIHSKNTNLDKWSSKQVKGEKLDALYTFLTEGGFADSIYPFNLPFTHDGKWAVIDTEKYYAWPINYHLLTIYLHYNMQVHWEHLIDNGGP